MAASFIGLTVEIQLITGETISGAISNVDPIGGLSVYNPGNHSTYNINRNQIRDLQLIQQQQQQQPQSQSQSQQQPSSSYSSNSHSNSFATHSDPAILSLSSNHNQNQIQNHTSFSNQNQNQVTPSSIPAPSTSHQSIPPTSNQTKNKNKQTNDSVSNQNQNQNQNAKIDKSKKVQEEKNKSKKNGNGKSNQQQSANQSNVKGKSRAKNGNNNLNGNGNYPNGIGGGFEEDFDFSAGLNNFDKKAIWEEIRISDQSDKSTLLVSHNRISQSRDQGSSSPSPHPYHSTKQLTKDGRNGQTKLAPNENVLSPEPDEDQNQDEDDREVEELLEKVKEGGLNLNGESFEKEGLQEEDDDEDEDESDEFMEALSSPSPAFASSIKRNGSSSSKKTTGMLEIPNSTLTLPETQKLPQPNFSERPRSSSSTSQNLNGNLESITTSTSTSTQSLLSEIQSLKEKLILFETLSSISLDLNPELKCANAAEKGSQVYDCRLNGFKFSLACFFDQENQSRGGSPSPSLERIRYLPSRLEERGREGGNEDGNGVGESQESILKKLPGHYSKEIGLRPENAGVFIGRLRDALKS